MNGNSSGVAYGVWLLVVGALAGLGLSLFNFFWTGNGIHGTAGALLVIVSSALMALAAVALAVWPGTRRGLRGTLLVLIGLDILGNGVAAYMLEAEWLIAAMAVALIGWLAHLAADPGPNRRPANTPAPHSSVLASRDAS